MAEGPSAGEANIDFDAWRANIRRDALSNHHYSMARAIAREGNRPAAIERLRLAIGVDGGMVAAHAELAALLRATGLEAEALAAEAEAAALDPDWRARAALRRGRELVATARPDEALAELAVAETSPALRTQARAEIADIHFAQALRHHAAGDLEATFTAMRVALSYDDANPILLHHISHQYFAAGDLDTAAACAAKATRLTTDAHRLEYLRLATNFLERQGRWGALADLAAEVVAASPDQGEAHVLLAQARLMDGQTDRALRAAEIGLARTPDLPAFWMVKAIALYDSRQDGPAERLLRRLLVLRPEHGAGRVLLTSLLLTAGRQAEAEALAKTCPKPLPGASAHPLHAVALALVMAQREGTEAARRLLRDAAPGVGSLPPFPGWIFGRVQARHPALFASDTSGPSMPSP